MTQCCSLVAFPICILQFFFWLQLEPGRSALSSVWFTQAEVFWSAADIQISSAEFSKCPAWFSLPESWIESLLSFFAFPSLKALADDG